MIRIVKRNVRNCFFYYKNSEEKRVESTFFEITKDIKSIKPFEQVAYDTYPAKIEVNDDIGRMFSVVQKPPITSYGLGCRITDVRKDVLQELFDLGVPNDYSINKSVCCVDPRVIMAHSLIWWRCPHRKETMEILGEAFTPTPNYEEAEKWLIDNQFIGENALQEDGYPGRSVYAFDTPKTFKNLPEKYVKAIEKICAIVKKNKDKKLDGYSLNDWRIQK